MTGPVDIGPLELAAAAFLLLLNGLVSVALGLGLERRLAVAALRSVVQLTLLGAVLVPVFSIAHPALVLGLAAVMIALAGVEAVRRTTRSFRGARWAGLGAMAVSASVTTALATAVILDVSPWWTPRYFIPMLGMILGNSLTGVSLGLETSLRLLDTRRAEVERLLAFGASWWEASRDIAAEAVRTGMIPILNTMSVVGLVTIPGMMTGQILGGTAPGLAARYQMLILFLIAAAVALGTTLATLVAVRAVFDGEDRLRAERILGG
ncbi:MAG: ABC transporter permease [Alphaproteobacteria bacterium]|nr:ABC transporter permease [Alphaproteobacteria bacterium]